MRGQAEIIMANRIIMSLVFIVLGLLTAILPHTFLAVCASTVEAVSGVHVPMRCFWTAQMATGMGALCCLSGLGLYFSVKIRIRLGISLMICANALLLAAVPTLLIGVCPSQTMPCQMGTLPGLLVLAVLIMAAGLANLFWLHRLSKRESCS